jgi:hypothetical protein
VNGAWSLNDGLTIPPAVGSVSINHDAICLAIGGQRAQRLKGSTVVPLSAASAWVTNRSAQMFNSLAAFGIFALLEASVVAIPWFAPKAEAGETSVLAKSGVL